MTALFEPEPDQGLRPGADFSWILLRRHARRPLGLHARTLLHADNRCSGLGLWSSLTILETAQGRFATSLRHAAPDGWDWQDARLAETPDTLKQDLLSHDPLSAVPSRWHPDARTFLVAWYGLLAATFGVKAVRNAEAA